MRVKDHFLGEYIAHEPETNPDKITAERLRKNGWPEQTVQRFEEIRAGAAERIVRLTAS